MKSEQLNRCVEQRDTAWRLYRATRREYWLDIALIFDKLAMRMIRGTFPARATRTLALGD